MKYNLAKYSQTISSGTISLDTDDIINIISSTSAGVSISGPGTIILDCDLGSRFHVDEIQYYSTTSGITFYYKNESFESYIPLTTYYSGVYYYTTISGYSAPRYIKVEQTISTSGTINGFVIQNNEDYVDFGTDGNTTTHNINTTIENDSDQIDTLSVYNSTDTVATARVFLEPQDSIIDELLSISTSSNGPWYGVYQDDDKISGSTIWDTGSYNNTEVNADILTLSTGNTEGDYTTRIFQLTDNQKLTYPIIKVVYPTLSSGISLIATDSGDTYENIEVRSSNYRPLDRDTYIWMSGSYGSSTKYTNHSWIGDGSLESQSSDWGTWGQTFNYWEYWFDSVREDEYIIDKPFHTSTITEIIFRIRRKNGALYSSTISNANYNTDCWFSAYKLSFDSYGGFWIYYYLHRSATGVDGGNFYLRYYDATLVNGYSKSVSSDVGTFLYDLSSVYSSDGDMWYTDIDQGAVFKIDKTGAILATKAETANIKGIVALDDGGCWYIREGELIRLNDSAAVIDSFDLPSTTASYVYLDPAGEGFWIQDGTIVRFLNTSGTEIFNIEIPNLLWITPINSGVITKEHDGSTIVAPTTSYISKYYQRIMRTWSYPQTEGAYKGTFDYNRFGSRSHSYDDLEDDHASHFPISIDNQWNSLEWKKVSLRNYNFTNEEYHQMRITLRADLDVNTPEVYGLWTQRAIELQNVLPNNYVNFYLKASVSELDYNDVGNYSSNIRAWWYIEES